MPFDPPTHRAPIQTRARRDPAVATWLFMLCAMLLVMVTLGGATRLTGSGLSIMEWAPLMGTLPPFSEAEWRRLYALYQQIPQYALVNQGFGLEGFKGIFWLEWTHRLWGRLMGAALVLPLLVFAWRGRIPRPLGLRLLALLALGAVQGLVGWLMVRSGFEADRTAVSPYRLVLHLALAMGLYAALLWTALGVLRGPPPSRPAPARLLACTAASVVVTMLAGGFVAGLKAGLTYNSFPFMDGQLVPPGYASLHPWVLNLFENVAAVQFDHRLLATATLLLACLATGLGLRRATGALRAALFALGAAVIAQYGLGVLTLLRAVPIPLGAAHQAMAMLVLTAALVALHLRRRPAPDPLR